MWAETFQSIGLDSAETPRDRLILRFQTHHDDEATRSANTATASVPLHRDTWGSNLYAQINWWAPVYPLTSGRTLALYPQVFDQALRNSTAAFDLPAVVRRRRASGATGISVGEVVPWLLEAMKPEHPLPIEIEPGELIAFSSAHLHGSIANQTGLTRVSMERGPCASTMSLPAAAQPMSTATARGRRRGGFSASQTSGTLRTFSGANASVLISSSEAPGSHLRRQLAPAASGLIWCRLPPSCRRRRPSDTLLRASRATRSKKRPRWRAVSRGPVD